MLQKRSLQKLLPITLSLGLSLGCFAISPPQSGAQKPVHQSVRDEPTGVLFIDELSTRPSPPVSSKLSTTSDFEGGVSVSNAKSIKAILGPYLESIAITHVTNFETHALFSVAREAISDALLKSPKTLYRYEPWANAVKPDFVARLNYSKGKSGELSLSYGYLCFQEFNGKHWWARFTMTEELNLEKVYGTLGFKQGSGYFVEDIGHRIWLRATEDKIQAAQLDSLLEKKVVATGELRTIPKNVTTNIPAGADYLAYGFKVEASGPALRLNIRSLADKIYRGDPIPIQFTIENTGSKNYSYLDRSYDRAGRMPEYELECFSQNGGTADPRKNYGLTSMGGLAQKANLLPGQTFQKTIDLNRWAKQEHADSYTVTGKYHPEDGSAVIKSAPIKIQVHPRTNTEMTDYVRSIERKIASSNSRTDTEDLFQQLMYTLDPSIIPHVIDWMYAKPHETFWLTETLSFYLPPSLVKPAILHACATRGLAPGMASTLYNLARSNGKWNVNPLSDQEWKSFINKSLSADNRACWAEGALNAQSHPDDSHTARLIVIATDPKSEARTQAIYALAMNRTDASVKALKNLLKDPDDGVKTTAKSAIQAAYNYHGAEVPGRRLLKTDFP